MKRLRLHKIKKARFKYGDYVLLKNDRNNILFAVYEVYGSMYALIAVRSGIVQKYSFEDKQLIPTEVEGESNVQSGE